MADLLIKISAETKEFEDAVDEIKGKTSSLEGQLNSIAKVSGVAFAGLIASAGLAIHAYADAEKSTRELVNSLQNQGIASDQLIAKYRGLAEEVQKKTGIDDDAIIKGQAIIQSYIGQTEITGELTSALADLSERTGSVDEAAKILGLAIAGNTRGLKQFHIEIADGLDKNERMAEILRQLNLRMGGLAEANNKGLGSIRGLTTAFGNFLEAIGERLAPFVTSATIALTNFFNALNSNKPLLDFIFEVGKIAAIITGVVTALASTGIAIVKLSQAFAIAQQAVTAFGLASRVAVGATGIGLLLIIATEIYTHWNSIWPVMQAVFTTFVDNVSKLAGGLGNILAGIFTGNLGRIKDGLSSLKEVALKGFDNIKKALPNNGNIEVNIVQDPAKKAAALAAAKESADSITEIDRAKNDLILLQSQAASDQLITLKKQEIALLEALEKETNDAKAAQLDEQLATTQAKLLEQTQTDIERLDTFNKIKLATDEEFYAKSSENRNLYLEEQRKKFSESILTEKTAREAAQADSIKKQIDTNNRLLDDQVRYGKTYATINQVLNDSRVQGAQKAGGELTKLQTSEIAELRAIGKAAAVSQITIDTARSAMSIYTGFSVIPIIGPILGVAGAAAAVAFGAEQIRKVFSAQEGGIVPGANTGGDSIPSLLQAGELVVPRSNFSEVVNAVASSRANDSVQGSSGVSVAGGGGGTAVSVNLSFSGDQAEKFLTARQVESRSLGTLREATA